MMPVGRGRGRGRGQRQTQSVARVGAVSGAVANAGESPQCANHSDSVPKVVYAAKKKHDTILVNIFTRCISQGGIYNFMIVLFFLQTVHLNNCHHFQILQRQRKYERQERTGAEVICKVKNKSHGTQQYEESSDDEDKEESSQDDDGE